MENEWINNAKGKLKRQEENLLPCHFVHQIMHTDRHRQIIPNCNKVINEQISTRHLYNNHFNIVQICHDHPSFRSFPTK
jgi:superoxide dismutase